MYIFQLKKRLIHFTLLISLSNLLISQNNEQNRLPNYPIPYTLPQVDSIKLICDKVLNYCLESSPLKIVDKETGEEITDFTQPNKNAIVYRGLFTEWSYTQGVVISANDYMFEITGDSNYLNYNTRFYNFLFDYLPYFRKNKELYGYRSSGWRRIFYMEALDHCGAIGCGLIKTYKRNPDERYRAMIDTVADFITNRQYRFEDGTLARQRPQPKSLWADDMYMGVSFIAQMADLTKDKKYYDDAVRQVIQLSNRLFIKDKGLYDHGWNETSAGYDPRFYWARANGWTLMAMAELLSVLPQDYKGRDEILHLYRTLIQTLANLQDGTGFWHNMLDKTDTYLETSATAMFVYAIARGINEGWINHVYGPVAQTGWNALVTVINNEGAVDGTCEGTTFAHDNVYYYYRGKSIYAEHGYGPVLYAGAEMIKLLQNDKIEIQKAKPNSINSTYHYKLKE